MRDRDQYIQDRIEELADLGLSARESKRVAEAEYRRKCQQKPNRDQEDQLYEDLLLEQQEQM